MQEGSEFEKRAMALSPTLYRVCLSLLKKEADAQDAVQETLARAWERRAKIRKDSFGPYLTRVAVNCCYDILRKRKRQVPVMDFPEEEAQIPQSDLDLKAAVEGLKDTLRLPILLYYLEGWTDQMIARALAITAPAVRRRLSRARKQLKAALDDLGEEDLG